MNGMVAIDSLVGEYVIINDSQSYKVLSAVWTDKFNPGRPVITWCLMNVKTGLIAEYTDPTNIRVQI